MTAPPNVADRIPAVSVIMPAYNSAEHIEMSVRSILNQTFADFELIVVDDTSSDETFDILTRLAAEDARIRLHQAEQNRGNAVARNKGLDMARAPLIAMMDSDDISHPQRLEIQVAAMAADPECLLLASSVHWIDPKGRVFATHISDGDGVMMRWILCFKMLLIQSSFLFRRTFPNGTPVRYDETFRQTQDYDLLARLLLQGAIRCLPDVLVAYRVHPKQVSSEHRKKQTARALQVAGRLRTQLLPIPVATALEAVSEAIYRGGVDSHDILEGLAQHCSNGALTSPSHQGAIETAAALEAHFLLTRVTGSQVRALALLARRYPRWAVRVALAKLSKVPAKRHARTEWASIPTGQDGAL